MQKKKKQLLQRVRYHDVDKLKERVKKETPPPGVWIYWFKEGDFSKHMSNMAFC